MGFVAAAERFRALTCCGRHDVGRLQRALIGAVVGCWLVSAAWWRCRSIKWPPPFYCITRAQVEAREEPPVPVRSAKVSAPTEDPIH